MPSTADVTSSKWASLLSCNSFISASISAFTSSKWASLLDCRLLTATCVSSPSAEISASTRSNSASITPSSDNSDLTSVSKPSTPSRWPTKSERWPLLTPTAANTPLRCVLICWAQLIIVCSSPSLSSHSHAVLNWPKSTLTSVALVTRALSFWFIAPKTPVPTPNSLSANAPAIPVSCPRTDVSVVWLSCNLQ